MSEKAATAPKSKKKVTLKVLSIIGWAVIGLLFLVSLVNVIDRATKYNFSLFGLRANVILSNSMAEDISGTTSEYEFHQLQIDDVVITYQTSYENVNVGDIIIYYSNAGLICHRVIEKYESENYHYFVTKGDNNEISDIPVENKDFKGKVVSIVPKVGVVVSFMQSYYFLIALGFSGFLIFGTVYVFKLTEERKEKKNVDNKENK